jgi:copper chaperone CopZ
MKIEQLEVEGMSCQHCVRAVREALTAVPGVAGVEVEVGHASLEVDEGTRREALTEAVSSAGYRVIGA